MSIVNNQRGGKTSTTLLSVITVKAMPAIRHPRSRFRDQVFVFVRKLMQLGDYQYGWVYIRGR